VDECCNYAVSIAVPRPLDQTFTYKLRDSLVEQIEVGSVVNVTFGKARTHAYVVDKPTLISEIKENIPADLKEIKEIVPGGSVFSKDVFALCKWAHDYYRYPLGEILNSAAPASAIGLRSESLKARQLKTSQDRQQILRELTQEQKNALATIQKSTSKTVLLHGVTASGKTEIYIELTKKALSEGKGAIILVPEIALTPQLLRRFEENIGADIGLWHSALSDGLRRDIFAALKSGTLKVILGARSAIFTPVKDLGLIVVDEEHDPSYKQEERFRYNARDLAVVRGKLSNALVILGSATPSLETRERVREGKYSLAELKQRVANKALPKIDIIDLRKEEKIADIQAPLALCTVEALKKTIADGNQAMVFLNRRGFAAFLICEECGDVTECPNCSISLVVHKKKMKLRCHVCGYQKSIPRQCPICFGNRLKPMGAGTESLEEDLPRLVEGAVTLRLDRDKVTSAKRLEEVLNEFRSGKANVLLGTQMLVKGHDFPGVTLVVVVLADGLFRWPDFRASERGLQVLTQVSGRAGRGDQPGKVLIQTFNPEHEIIKVLTGTQNEEAFLNTERELRQTLSYPPFGRLARIRFEAANTIDSEKRARHVTDALKQIKIEQLELLGPSEAFLEKVKGVFRWDLLLRSRDIRHIQIAITRAKDICLTQKWPLLVDVDPYGVG